MDRRGWRLLLFDGDCGLCTRVVQVVLRADPHGSLRFASLQGEFARDLLARHPELRGVDSIAWVDFPPEGAGERVLVRSEAALTLARYLGFPWNLLTLARVVPASLRDGLYDWVARRRHRWFQGAPACDLTAPEQHRRMVNS